MRTSAMLAVPSAAVRRGSCVWHPAPTTEPIIAAVNRALFTPRCNFLLLSFTLITLLIHHFTDVLTNKSPESCRLTVPPRTSE